ncbi:hypothetical protein [Mycobacterium sp. ITM-2016-00318]|uniref:hypothetical protein n=1 Tax=Mycobacterium sp. ITM-2016-00318 TaxID=2099693 RepID=UPI000CF95CB5|nr:hypothetical protein [Mycobacterium sp. ITM-2016-00318]WNG92650.1 hypothetical protein C6A82_025270 [Mycobacterium sp. ITM-2016-00318]
MNEQPNVEGASLGDVLDALVAGMSSEQFSELAERTGHKSGKERAAEALSRFQRKQNLTGEDGLASTASAEAALRRHGRRR